jgi:ABC-type dipeptide/oligopeptide/nickel transport system ATPase subunit
MIKARELTKRYGATTAVDGISFTIAPRSVTGSLGPNGAGKSTTMRMIMGLDQPSSGTVTVIGKPYAKHRAPLSEVGALLDEPVNGLDPGCPFFGRDDGAHSVTTRTPRRPGRAALASPARTGTRCPG